MIRKNCRCSTGNADDNFVGIKFFKDSFTITFPIGYNIPSDEKLLKKSIFSLLKSISLTNSVEKIKSELNDKHKNEYYIPIVSYIFLLKNYLQNGLYRNQEKVYNKKNCDKINWKRTIQNGNATITNNNIIFMEPFYEKKIKTENIITEIQKYCLRIAYSVMGWYFGYISIPRSIFSEANNDYLISIIKKELISSFTDYKKTLLHNMLDILQGLDTKKHSNKIFTFGTYNYNVVWEKMIADTFGTEDINEYFPSATWHLITNENSKASNLRPDCIRIENNLCFVIDAKYYHYSLNPLISNLPASDSIQKQITYASYIHQNKSIKAENIYNAFILPFNYKDSKISNPDGQIIKYYGYADCNWMISKNNNCYNYHKVALIFLDTKSLIDNWICKDHSISEKLIENIQTMMLV